MSANKLASFRYRVINNCLQNRARLWTRIDLMYEIEERLDHDFGIKKGISKRTFHYDVDIMRSDPPRGFGAPIIVENGYYRYENVDYSIDKIGLNDTDIESIKGAVELLSHFKQLPIHSQLSLVKDKVTGQILTSHANEPIIELEHIEVIGMQHLTPLYNFIKNKEVIWLTYKSFNSPSQKRHQLHPYFLKQYNHRWYLMALNKKHNSVGTYSLDRIIKVDVAVGVEFDNSRNINHDKHFQHIFGVTLEANKEPVEIIASISKEQKPYVKTKKLHRSQEILNEEDNGGMTISLKIIPNYEFYSSILSAGDGIEIISPTEVRNKIIERLRNAYKQYNEK